MTESVEVYGFGSFFKDQPRFNDIDVLILHQDVSVRSCQFAIRCKLRLVATVPSVDVTLLSKQEEGETDLIKTSGALLLGRIEARSFEQDVEAISEKVVHFPQ
jgi:hypothetical protein